MLRDVYYSLKYLFESQDACNEAIFNLGKLLQLKRSRQCFINRRCSKIVLILFVVRRYEHYSIFQRTDLWSSSVFN